MIVAIVSALALAGAIDRLLQFTGRGVWSPAGVPVLGLKLGRRVSMVLNILPMLCVPAVVHFASGWARWAIVGILVAAWLLSFENRLPNHSVLTGIGLVVFSAPFGVTSLTFGVLLAGVYVSAAVFKCNGTYLFRDQSPGRVFAADFLAKCGITPRRGLVVFASYTAVAMEYLLACALLLNWDSVGVVLAAVIVHFAFGALALGGNFDFSAVMMILWLGYLAVDVNLSDVLRLGAGVSIATAAATLVAAYFTVSRQSCSAGVLFSRLVDAVLFGLIGGLAISLSSRGYGEVDWGVLEWTILGCTIINIASVVLGLRLEASFAMFSGIDPRVGWNGLSVVRRPRYRGLEISGPIEMMRLKSLSPQFAQLVDGEVVASAATFRRLRLALPGVEVPLAGDVANTWHTALCERLVLFPLYLPSDPAGSYRG